MKILLLLPYAQNYIMIATSVKVSPSLAIFSEISPNLARILASQKWIQNCDTWIIFLAVFFLPSWVWVRKAEFLKQGTPFPPGPSRKDFKNANFLHIMFFNENFCRESLIQVISFIIYKTFYMENTFFKSIIVCSTFK